MDVQTFFNKTLPRALAERPDEARVLGAKFRLHVTGEGGGDWLVDVSDSGPRVMADSTEEAQCTIEVPASSFGDLLERPKVLGLKLYFAGQLKVTGDYRLAMKLEKLLNLTDHPGQGARAS